jgi:hypothetical protein
MICLGDKNQLLDAQDIGIYVWIRHMCKVIMLQISISYALINFLFGECFHYLTFDILPCHDLYVNVSMCHYRYEFGFPAVEKPRGYTQLV